MIESLTKSFKNMEKELKIPKQWENIIIRSVNKNKKGKSIAETQRGLFIVNTVSKVYEREKSSRTKTSSMRFKWPEEKEDHLVISS